MNFLFAFFLTYANVGHGKAEKQDLLHFWAHVNVGERKKENVVEFHPGINLSNRARKEGEKRGRIGEEKKKLRKTGITRGSRKASLVRSISMSGTFLNVKRKTRRCRGRFRGANGNECGSMRLFDASISSQGTHVPRGARFENVIVEARRPASTPTNELVARRKRECKRRTAFFNRASNFVFLASLFYPSLLCILSEVSTCKNLKAKDARDVRCILKPSRDPRTTVAKLNLTSRSIPSGHGNQKIDCYS